MCEAAIAGGAFDIVDLEDFAAIGLQQPQYGVKL